MSHVYTFQTYFSLPLHVNVQILSFACNNMTDNFFMQYKVHLYIISAMLVIA